MKSICLIFFFSPIVLLGQNIIPLSEEVKKEYFESGALKFEKNFKNKVQHGKTVFYFENGNRRIERNFKEGKMHGKEFWYFQNGQIGWEQNYDNGVPEAKWIYYSSDGIKQAEKVFKEGKEVSYSVLGEKIRAD
ncbi:MAG: hypothetical protein MUR17_07045 [Flavobacteriaceae bacterium]|mgnify:FL=1|nr:hypothetical protein [Flavobacteriaceae bacterium]